MRYVMWVILGIIFVVVICAAYSTFSKGVDNSVKNLEDNYDKNKWWYIGMIADMHNKHNKKQYII